MEENLLSRPFINSSHRKAMSNACPVAFSFGYVPNLPWRLTVPGTKQELIDTFLLYLQEPVIAANIVMTFCLLALSKEKEIH